MAPGAALFSGEIGGHFMQLDQIASRALALDPAERASLAEALWESLGDPYMIPGDLSDKEAIQLAVKRDEEMETGVVEPISHSELMRRLRGNAD
jgi:hypothetical protein